MRYFEITEQINKEDNISTIVSTLLYECSDIIKEYKKTSKVLYHGMGEMGLNRISKSFGFVIPRENRMPKNSSEEFQKAIDFYLVENKFKALRSNSYFTTSGIENTRLYGKTFVVFPSNGYNFTWFKNVDDLYSFDDEYLMNVQDYYETKIDDTMSPNQKEEIKKKINKKVISDIMAKAQPSKMNLNLAIDSGHEIMFTGKFYYVDYKYFSDNIKDFEVLF